ncbi:MAG: TIGR02391 family protein [Candidatus Lokiarchaeota archaeon]|nr:TIGR02391 family protein [Candidatus Lokiarchaeota archaeon]
MIKLLNYRRIIKLNLETSIDEHLWETIKISYKSDNYTGAILDAIYYLSYIIREKTGLESDGTVLIGQAFGGKNPKLKVNKLQTESDWNIQKGLEQILRGVYQSIRNPRSHEKYDDNIEDATAIIFFLSYLLNIIVKSKSPFTKSDFLKRVFDPYFVEKDRYAELLVNEIPNKLKLDILIEVYRNKENTSGNKLSYFIMALYKKLSSDEIKTLGDVVSEELKCTDNDSSICYTIQCFPIGFWDFIDESAKLRTENKLLKSIEEGLYSINKKEFINGKGSVGTWAEKLLDIALLKEDFASNLLFKLASDNKYESDYVFKYFFKTLFKVLPKLSTGEEGDFYIEFPSSVVNEGLKNGDRRFHNALYLIMKQGPKIWQKKFQEAYDNFKANQQ